MGDIEKGAEVSRRDCLAAVGGLIASSVASSRAACADATQDADEKRSIWGRFETPGVEFVLQAHVMISPVINIGQSSYGLRRIIPITGGTFHGPRLAGTVLDQGEDTQLVRPDGLTEIVARYTLRTHDGVLIYVVNSGLIDRGPAAAEHAMPGRPLYVRTIPKFEAPLGSPYDWMNKALYVGTLNPLPQAERAVVVRFFKVT